MYQNLIYYQLIQGEQTTIKIMFLYATYLLCDYLLIIWIN